MDPINNSQTTPFQLPPGCRFHPSEEQLIRYYLTGKNTTGALSSSDHNVFGFNAIGELDLYGYEPFNLPDTACFGFGHGGRRRHWYCYTARVLKEKGRRKAGGGFWKRTGRVRDVVVGKDKVTLGRRTTFAFYLGNSSKSAVRTDWVMFEYALVDHLKASFVLCRVFVKSPSGNNASDHVISSCGEESVSAVRHVGIQHDGTATSDIVEANVHGDNSVDTKNEIPKISARLLSELDDQVMTHRGFVADFNFPLGIQAHNPVMSTSGSTRFVDGTTQGLMSILEEDFIELDDLVYPLLGIDQSG